MILTGKELIPYSSNPILAALTCLSIELDKALNVQFFLGKK